MTSEQVRLIHRLIHDVVEGWQNHVAKDPLIYCANTAIMNRRRTKYNNIG
jgi:hypothetical protein